MKTKMIFIHVHRGAGTRLSIHLPLQKLLEGTWFFERNADEQSQLIRMQAIETPSEEYFETTHLVLETTFDEKFAFVTDMFIKHHEKIRQDNKTGRPHSDIVTDSLLDVPLWSFELKGLNLEDTRYFAVGRKMYTDKESRPFHAPFYLMSTEPIGISYH